ncbi:MAG: AlpA family phage regulatory protein [Burkholderiaceae bacterium]|nr:MAG: AlpA family phage regulatory protein [Burkholderiaceae bacterium]
MNAAAIEPRTVAGFIPLRGVCNTTTKSKPTIYRWVREGIFPAPVKIGPNSVAWRTEDVQAWARDPQAWREARAAQ